MGQQEGEKIEYGATIYTPELQNISDMVIQIAFQLVSFHSQINFT